jgi:hypothetical protein
LPPLRYQQKWVFADACGRIPGILEHWQPAGKNPSKVFFVAQPAGAALDDADPSIRHAPVPNFKPHAEIQTETRSSLAGCPALALDLTGQSQ